METKFIFRYAFSTSKLNYEMTNKLNSFTENTIRLVVLERIQQLEQLSSSVNVIKKQTELNQLANELIIRANTALPGLVEIVFTNREVSEEITLEEILLNSLCKISGFNVQNPKDLNSPFRTIIIVDPTWSTNFKLYGGQYGAPIFHMKEL